MLIATTTRPARAVHSSSFPNDNMTTATYNITGVYLVVT